MRLPNKVAIITGAASGIGRATALVSAKKARLSRSSTVTLSRAMKFLVRFALLGGKRFISPWTFPKKRT